MTPLQFEARYAADWTTLQEQVRLYMEARRKRGGGDAHLPGEQFAALYRRVCEQLSLARERAYPAYLVDRLERLAADAHQLIYQQGASFGLAGLREFLLRGFPRCVRRHSRYVWAATLLLAVPTLAIGVLMSQRPELILTVVDAAQARSFEYMYSDAADNIGRPEDVATNWGAFGHYISNNIGVAFRCFAGGLFLGVGSIFFLVYNGALAGAVGGFLTERGLGHNFYSFVATHAAFELTAIVLSGAAGLRIGHALLAPGRLTRRDSLVRATREVTPLIYGFVVMLLVAAAIEAFWSSARWLPDGVKYAVAAACWAGVLAYFTWQGRRSAD
jgi:uncharacterized membrane protein SpoIIM required for sporulation